MKKPIKNLKFVKAKYPEVLEVVNELAALEERSAHDVGKRLILKSGHDRLRELKSIRSEPQPACAG